MTTPNFYVLDTDLTTLSPSSPLGHPLHDVRGDLDVGTIVAGRRPLLGVDSGAAADDDLDAPHGAVFALFTDGLVERRGESIIDGLDRL